MALTTLPRHGALGNVGEAQSAGHVGGRQRVDYCWPTTSPADVTANPAA
jgi:hypothetical protein